MTSVKFRVVLVGAGHVHLHVLRNAAVLRAAGVEPILVSPATFHYSGLATGVLSGALEPGRATVDVTALTADFGVRHIVAEASHIDLADKQVQLTEGRVLSFDAISINVGSVTADPGLAGQQPGVWSTKPLAGLIDLRACIEAHVRSHGQSPALVVAGSGPSGFEIAAALAGLLEREGVAPHIQLVVKTLPGWGPGAAMSRLTRALQRRGVGLVSGEVLARHDGVCVLSDGQSLPCDMLVMATGLAAAAVVAALPLPRNAEGRLRVGPTLQSIGDPGAFAVGDAAVIEGASRPAAGVFGVRAAPVLLHNLAALGLGAPMRRFQPQRRWLSIMDLGDGTGLAMRGRLWWMGRTALALKRRLDLGFIDRMRAPSGEPFEHRNQFSGPV